MFGVCGFIHSRLDINLRHLNSTNDTNFAYLLMARLNDIHKKLQNVKKPHRLEKWIFKKKVLHVAKYGKQCYLFFLIFNKEKSNENKEPWLFEQVCTPVYHRKLFRNISSALSQPFISNIAMTTCYLLFTTHI